MINGLAHHRIQSHTCQNTADFQARDEGSSIKGIKLVPLAKKCNMSLNAYEVRTSPQAQKAMSPLFAKSAKLT